MGLRHLAMAVAVAWASVARAGPAAPDFGLRDLAGSQVALSSFEGKVVVLSFWATWCGPCKEELPHLQRMLDAYGAQGLVVLAIATDDARSVGRVKPYVAKMGYTFPVLLDRQSKGISAYEPSKKLPTTVVIDRRGEVVRKTTGYEPGDEVELEALVKATLGGG